MKEIKKEAADHLIVGLVFFILIEIVWLLKGRFSLIGGGSFLLGLLLGSFILEGDHLIYWFFLYPDLEESKKARRFYQERKWSQLLFLLGENHRRHLSLVFHHFLFQAVLAVLTLFILTSTASLLAQGLVLGASLHLLTDEWQDWRREKTYLQQWLWARTPLAKAPLPSSWLTIYLIFYSFILGGLVYVFLS